jgi:chromosome segregation ATPase
VTQTSRDAAAARILAGGADRDVSDVRSELWAHTQALNALRETQRELGDAQREMQATLRDHGERLTTVENTMRAGFAEMKSGMAQIVTLLGGRPPSA